MTFDISKLSDEDIDTILAELPPAPYGEGPDRMALWQFAANQALERHVGDTVTVIGPVTPQHLVQALMETGVSENDALKRVLAGNHDELYQANQALVDRIRTTEHEHQKAAAKREYDASEQGKRAAAKELLKRQQELKEDAVLADAALREANLLPSGELERMSDEAKVALWKDGDLTPGKMLASQGLPAQSTSKYAADFGVVDAGADDVGENLKRAGFDGGSE